MKIDGMMCGWDSPNVCVKLKCSNCGAMLYGSENFCPKCGRKLVRKYGNVPKKDILSAIDGLDAVRVQEGASDDNGVQS